MRKYLLLAVSSLNLAACQEADEENTVAPAAIATTFDQDFSLNYRQQATLSVSSQPELTVAVADLYYQFCPKNANCFAADCVNPTLSVTDMGGQTQRVKMSTYSRHFNYPNWVDTTSVRANGRQYMVYYIIYEVKAGRDNPEKKDISVALRVSKPSSN